MTTRQERRAQARSDANRSQVGMAPTEWNALTHVQKRRAVARNTRQLAVCPHCEGPVDGLLAGCNKPDCLSADIAYDTAIDLRCEDQ